MATLSATLSSSTGTAIIPLNPLAKSTTVMLTQSLATSTGVVQIDMSLDDPSQLGAGTATWAVMSSGAAMVSSTTGAGTLAVGLVYTVLSPVGMVRINSTANNTSNTFTLKALQSITA